MLSTASADPTVRKAQQMDEGKFLGMAQKKLCRIIE